MARLLTCCVLSLAVANAQVYRFCTNGVPKADFAEGSPVQVILAQAPLFSSNPKIGDKGKYFNLYHSTIIFRQGNGTNEKYWTMEFDYTGPSVLESIVPAIAENSALPGGVSLTWNNDARYCLSEGLMWGRAHWSKTFEVVANLTTVQAKQAFSDFVTSVNTSAHSPQYSLWQVSKTLFGIVEKTFVPDLTCADGAVWFLHYLNSGMGSIIEFPPGFKFRATSAVMKAHSVTAVNTSDSGEVSKLVEFYKTLGDLVKGSSSVEKRLESIFELYFAHKYVYDANSKVYYQVHADYPAWLEFEYREFTLQPPPWMRNVVASNEASVVTLV